MEPNLPPCGGWAPPNYAYTRVSFPWLQCTCQPIIINYVVALQLVAWALLGNHSSTITIACGYSKSTITLIHTLVYGTNTLCV